jgi:hypothetical protein
MALLFALKSAGNKSLEIADINAILNKFDAQDTLLLGGFGAIDTITSTDWNALENTKSGFGATLLFGNATNGFGVAGQYFYAMNLEYPTKNGTGNITQIAIPYTVDASVAIYIRSRFSGVWTAWKKLILAAL